MATKFVRTTTRPYAGAVVSDGLFKGYVYDGADTMFVKLRKPGKTHKVWLPIDDQIVINYVANEPKPGNIITFYSGSQEYEVLAVDGDAIWVKNSEGGRGTFNLDAVNKIKEPCPC